MPERSNTPLAFDAQQYGIVLIGVFLAEGLVIVAVAIVTGTAPSRAAAAYFWGAAWFGGFWNSAMALSAAIYWLWRRGRGLPTQRNSDLPDGLSIGGVADALRTLRGALVPTLLLPVVLASLGSGVEAALLAGFSLVGVVDLTLVWLWRRWRVNKTGEHLYLVRGRRWKTEWYVRRALD